MKKVSIPAEYDGPEPVRVMSKEGFLRLLPYARYRGMTRKEARYFASITGRPLWLHIKVVAFDNRDSYILAFRAGEDIVHVAPVRCNHLYII